MPVAEAQRRISSREFAEWMAFYRVEPFGDRRGDWQVALIASLLANIHRDPKARPRPYELGDFLFDFWKPPKRPRPWQEMLQMVEMLNAAFGGDDKRHDTG